MNIGNVADALLYRIFGPFVIGYVLFWMIHWIFGLVANVESNNNEIRLTSWRYYYLIGVMKFKEYLWPWALGALVFMAIGLI